MPLYEVQGKTQAGTSVTRLLAAGTEREAIEHVRPTGVYVLEVRKLRTSTEPRLLSRAALAAAPITPENQALFFRHLAPLVKAGIGLPFALGRIAKRLPEPRLATLAGELSREVERGVPLSDCLQARGGYFPAWVPATIRAAERGGKPDELLPAITEELRLESAFHRRFAVPSAYLRASVVLGVIVPTIPFVMTLGTAGWAALAGVVGGIAALLVYGAAFAKRYAATSPRVRAVADQAVLALPGVGELRRTLGLLRFARVLRTMESAGLPLADAWETAGAAAGHGTLARGLTAGAQALREGRGLAEALRASGLFPDAHAQAAQAAEAEGALTRFLTWWQGELEIGSRQGADRAVRFLWVRLLALAAGVILVSSAVALAATFGNMLVMVERFFEE